MPQEFRYRIRPGHKHYVGKRRYGPGDEITFPRSMMDSDIRAKLEPLDEHLEQESRVVDQVATLRLREHDDGTCDLIGRDGRRINVTPMSKADAQAVIDVTTRPAEPKDEEPKDVEFKRPYSVESAGVGYVVKDAEGRKVHDKRSLSKAEAEALMTGNEA